jgi:hypothetical protein
VRCHSRKWREWLFFVHQSRSSADLLSDGARIDRMPANSHQCGEFMNTSLTFLIVSLHH